ncbi:hypothetical protein E3E36_04295 [Thermococcus sp. M36]|uniref:hypothetical protein n=1 Tax=Thermococcus sp. M36 TaxID=1638261 RepID=UPI00143897A0|nr:hypothetical protein [Thermococcus sp. M36]NJE05373.1 hypothetical protein [Thermococcus sp. M36]
MRMKLLALVALILIAGAGCIGGWGERTTSPSYFPGYGEFNAGNVLVGTGDNMRDYYGIVVPVNRTVTLRGLVFAKEYRVSSAGGEASTGYYGGRVELRAYLGEPGRHSSWSGLESKLRPVSGIEVGITPETLEVEPGKNGTFEVKINTANATPGKTYYLYIVASGEEGWKGWAVVEVITWATENTSP